MYHFHKNLKRRNIAGYSIIELLIVIAIIGILVTLMYGVLARGKREARDAVRIDSLNTFQAGLNAYFSLHGYYPCGDSNITSSWAGPIYNTDVKGNASVGGTVDSAGSCAGGSGSTTHGFLNGNANGGTASAARCPRGTVGGLVSEGLLSNNCPKDPVNNTVDGKNMGYLYMVDPDQSGYLLATYLEENSELMQNDGGVCSGVYEVNVGLPTGYAVPWATGLGRPGGVSMNGCP